MKRAALLLAGLMLCACTEPPPPAASFRDQAEALTVTSRATGTKMQGIWVPRALYPGDENLRAIQFDTPEGARPRIEILRNTCPGAVGPCANRPEQWDTQLPGNNIWRLENASGETRELWVIWVDPDFRTAAIGAPDGSFGWIIDRKATGGEDRITAARSILDFNGYDTSALKRR